MEGEEEGEEEEDAESDPKVGIFVCLVITQTVIMSDVTKVIIVFEKINKKTKTTLASDCNVFIFFSTQIALKRKVNVSIN